MDPQEVILKITADGRLEYVPEAFRQIVDAEIERVRDIEKNGAGLFND